MSLTISIGAARWISEKYFFDKFYYYKSVAHGYSIPGKRRTLEDFGLRSKDIRELLALKKRPGEGKELFLSPGGGDAFTIAVIGDSFVWGQGLREKDRFVHLLEKKLNKLYPTRVLSLALCGDGLLDNYIKYQLVKNNSNINLFVFGIVNNDLMLSNDSKYDLKLAKETMSFCPGAFLYSPVYDPGNPSQGGNYEELLRESYSDRFGNFCLLEKIAKLLPKDNSIYFNFARYNLSVLDTFESVLRKNGLRVISPRMYPDIFERYKFLKGNRSFVSAMEKHPSASANRMFADVLFYEISHNESFLRKVSNRRK